MRIVLVEPEIPQNTGSIARLAAATRTPLDLVGPLGFSLADRYLKRAGLDYWPLVDLTVYDDWDAYARAAHSGRMLAFAAKRERIYTGCEYRSDDRLFFGKESVGLGDRAPRRFRRGRLLDPDRRARRPQPQPRQRRQHRRLRSPPPAPHW